MELIPYLLNEDQKKTVIDEIIGSREWCSLETSQPLRLELERALEWQVQELIFEKLTPKQAEELGALMRSGASFLRIQALLLREIPQVSSLVSELLEQFLNYWAVPRFEGPGSYSSEHSYE